MLFSPISICWSEYINNILKKRIPKIRRVKEEILLRALTAIVDYRKVPIIRLL